MTRQNLYSTFAAEMKSSSLVAVILVAISCQASTDILDHLVPILVGNGGMGALQFEVDTADTISTACSQKYSAFQTVCTLSADSASCSGTSSCFYKRQRAFAAVVAACTASSNLNVLYDAAHQYVSDMGRCLKSNNQYCYVNGQNLLAGIANSTLSADGTHQVLSKICTSPAGCIGKALAWSIDPTERDACRLSSENNQWCARELFDLKNLIASKPNSVPDMSLLCTPCTRRFGYFPKYKIDTYCMRTGGSFCGDLLASTFNRSGTLAKTSPCADMDISSPGSCTDSCRDFLTGVVAESGCCLSSALQQAIAAASSDDANRLQAQIAYYQSDCGINIPDACDGPAQTSISFNIRITNLANPGKNAASLCSLIQTEVGGWFGVRPSRISCIYSANTAGSFQIDFFSSSGYIKDDLSYIQQQSSDGTLQMPLITSDYWSDTTLGTTVQVSNVASDNKYSHTSHAYSMSSTVLPILIMIAAIFVLF